MSKILSVRVNFLRQKRTFLKMSKNENPKYFSLKKSEKSEKMNCEHNGLIYILEISLCDHKIF